MNLRSLAIIGVVLVILLGIYTYANHGTAALSDGPKEISYSEMLNSIEANNIKDVTLHNEDVVAHDMTGKAYKTTTPFDQSDFLNTLHDHNKPLPVDKQTKVNVQSSRTSLLITAIQAILPIVLLVGIWIFFMRQMQGGGRGGAMGFGKSKARLLTEHKNRVTFNDVAGVDEAKEDLSEVVDFLKDPSKFQKLGGKIPKGALLVGPPGTGKTLLARAVAGEAGVPFFSISGSDFVEMFVGVGASRVRDMFDQAKKNAPCIIFIDEIDAVGRHRGAGHGGGNDEREQTLNQLLVEMDGFEANEGIIMIAATNRPDVLDTALLRPGRFDRQVTVPNPDLIGREAILRVHMKPVPLAVDVNVKVIARGTPGFSGADLANLVNEAALMAARKDRKLVTMRDFEDAKDKVLMGAERKSLAMSEDEKKNTAYHEGGHAIVALSVPQADPVHKATIIPRGRALGMVMQLPEGDRYSMNFTQMTSRLAIMMAGRVAEEIIMGKDNITSGASSDIQGATRLAKSMVTRWGFSDELGFVDYKQGEDEYGALGRDTSEATQQTIDAEVKRLINAGYEDAKRILTDKIDALHRLAKTLLDLETLTGDEILKVMNGEEIVRDEDTGVALEMAANVAVPETEARNVAKLGVVAE